MKYQLMSLEKNVEISQINGLMYTKNNLKDQALQETGTITTPP